MTPEQLQRLEKLAGGCTCPSAICYGDCLGYLAGLAVEEIAKLKVELIRLELKRDLKELKCSR